MAKRPRKTSRLESALNVANTPVFLLDHRRKVTFFNSGCEQLTGWSAEDVVGKVCDYDSDADHETIESLTGRLCPPPEVSAGKPVDVPTYLSQRTGNTVARLIHFFPDSDFAISVTECPRFDPDDTQSDAPVAYIALAGEELLEVRKQTLLGDPAITKSRTAKAVLNLLRQHLKQ